MVGLVSTLSGLPSKSFCPERQDSFTSKVDHPSSSVLIFDPGYDISCILQVWRNPLTISNFYKPSSHYFTDKTSFVNVTITSIRPVSFHLRRPFDHPPTTFIKFTLYYFWTCFLHRHPYILFFWVLYIEVRGNPHYLPSWNVYNFYLWLFSSYWPTYYRESIRCLCQSVTSVTDFVSMVSRLSLTCVPYFLSPGVYIGTSARCTSPVHLFLLGGPTFLEELFSSLCPVQMEVRRFLPFTLYSSVPTTQSIKSSL